MTATYHGKLGMIQRVLPDYRIPFFSLLSQICSGGLSLCYGEPRPIESIQTTDTAEQVGLYKTQNMHVFSGALYFCYQMKLIPWLEKTQPDALIIEANPRYLSTPAAINWMHHQHKPVIGWGLGVDSRRNYLNFGRSRFLNKFDAIIAYSQKGADEYASQGIDPSSIFVAKNAVSPRSIHPLPLRPDQIIGRAIILFVGRLQERKRIDHLIYACANLPENIKPYLWIVGEGPEQNDLCDLANKIYPDTQFFGAKYDSELFEIFQKADLFVLPGTGGLAVQQAMGFGLPVIVAEGDGTQNDLVRENNGWQVPPGDLKALTRTLEQALSAPKRLRKMGAESYRIVSEEININTMVEVFIQAVEYATLKITRTKRLD